MKSNFKFVALTLAFAMLLSIFAGPLDSDMGFLDDLDGFLYVFFGADETDFTQIHLQEEYS